MTPRDKRLHTQLQEDLTLLKLSLTSWNTIAKRSTKEPARTLRCWKYSAC